MVLRNVSFVNNTATSPIGQHGHNAGADCVCVLQESPGLPTAEGQCGGCRPSDNAGATDCIKAPGDLRGGQPTYWCPGGKADSDNYADGISELRGRA